jgi:hypothetical protein
MCAHLDLSACLIGFNSISLANFTFRIVMKIKSTSSFVDMHLHTHCSDGSFSPSKIVEQAKKANLVAIAITDHDTLDGVEEAVTAGKKLNIRVLAGIEISLDFVDNTHLLGNFPKGYSKDFLKILKELKHYREERIPLILEKLKNLDRPVLMKEVLKEAKGGLIGRPHIANIMVRKKYVASTKEAFDNYLASYAPAYVRKKKLTPAHAMALIIQSDGFPVLAHPYTMDFKPDILEEYMRTWKIFGLKGLEVLYSDYTPHQEKLFNHMADDMKLLKTGGSDFHGFTKSDISIGVGRGNLRIPSAYFDQIWDHA